jgi:hypothetical protein
VYKLIDKYPKITTILLFILYITFVLWQRTVSIEVAFLGSGAYIGLCALIGFGLVRYRRSNNP